MASHFLATERQTNFKVSLKWLFSEMFSQIVYILPEDRQCRRTVRILLGLMIEKESRLFPVFFGNFSLFTQLLAGLF